MKDIILAHPYLCAFVFLCVLNMVGTTILKVTGHD